MDYLAPMHDGKIYSPSAQIGSASAFAKNMFEPLPEQGQHFSPLIDHLFTQIVPNNLNEQHPAYMSYIPGGGLFQGAIGDWISAALNRHIGVSSVSPALVVSEWRFAKRPSRSTTIPQNSPAFQ